MIYSLTTSLLAADAFYIYTNKLVMPNSFDALMKMADKNEKLVWGSALGLGSVFSILTINKMFGSSDPLGKTWEMFKVFFSQEKTRKIKVDDVIGRYNELHDDSTEGVDGRNVDYTTLVNSYYELATLFYEWGWGQSFHFADKLPGESFRETVSRHEYYLAGRLGVKAGDKLLDVGCGVGGPMRNIAKFTRAHVTGVTLNEYQVQRGNKLNKAAGLEGKALSVQGNFMELPFADNSYDGVYAIEATCHAPVRQGVYSEIFRVLKPGQIFATYEWCLTPKYDKNNAEHRLIKKKIEEGDGLPDMASQEECVQALRDVGFEVSNGTSRSSSLNGERLCWSDLKLSDWSKSHGAIDFVKDEFNSVLSS
jgi:sterol 24-C-methyltransferase